MNGGNNTDKTRKPIPEWNDQQERLLQEWAEIASSYRWLHNKSFMEYRKKNFMYMIPIIIMSTITGTANFAQSSFPLVIRPYVPQIIGAINLFAAIVTTIHQYLKISEYMESHRLTGINYGKFNRNITVELALPIKDRSIGGRELVKISRLEIDRLIEQSPSIPKHIIVAYEEKFRDSGLAPPEIITIKKVMIYDDKEHKLTNTAVAKFKNVVNQTKPNIFKAESPDIQNYTKNGDNRVGVFPKQFKSSSPLKNFKDSISSELNNLKNSKLVSTFGESLKSFTIAGTSRSKESNSDIPDVQDIPSNSNGSDGQRSGSIESIPGLPDHNGSNGSNELTTENIVKLEQQLIHGHIRAFDPKENNSELEHIIIINDNSDLSNNSDQFHESTEGENNNVRTSMNQLMKMNKPN